MRRPTSGRLEGYRIRLFDARLRRDLKPALRSGLVSSGVGSRGPVALPRPGASASGPGAQPKSEVFCASPSAPPNLACEARPKTLLRQLVSARFPTACRECGQREKASNGNHPGPQAASLSFFRADSATAAHVSASARHACERSKV